MNAAATSLGASAGGLLGQFGDILSAPRRAFWGMFGGPETGDELVSNALGTERGSALSKALGFGAEMLLDPMTLGGAFLGSPMAKFLSAPWQRGRQLDAAVDTLQGANTLAKQAVADANMAATGLRESVPAVAEGFSTLNLPGIAMGEAKVVKHVTPGAAEALGGLAIPTAEGKTAVLGGMASNRGLPGGVSYKHMMNRQVGDAGTTMTGTGLSEASFAGTRPYMGAEDVGFLFGKQGSQSELARQLAAEQLSRAVPIEPSLGAVIGPSRLAPEIANMPVRQGMETIQAILPSLMREQGRYKITPADIGLIGGVGLGSLAGGSLGFQGY